ncbi:MAG: type II toxin-antitoxin system Phd/YefM family antitoxin [Pseudomonadota bacterium]
MDNINEIESYSIAETKAKLSEKIKRCNDNNRKFLITNHGKPVAVMLSYKEFLALSGKPKMRQRKIDYNEWLEDKGNRQEIVDSVSSLFNSEKLTRKGQKGYKNEKVKQAK